MKTRLTQDRTFRICLPVDLLQAKIGRPVEGRSTFRETTGLARGSSVHSMTTGSTASEGKAMYHRLSQAILTTLAVFTGAVALSMSTSGTLSDIGFFIYAAALVLLAALAVAWLIVRLRLRTARRRPDATTF
jgi:hypothetical protein